MPKPRSAEEFLPGDRVTPGPLLMNCEEAGDFIKKSWYLVVEHSNGRLKVQDDTGYYWWAGLSEADGFFQRHRWKRSRKASL